MKKWIEDNSGLLIVLLSFCLYWLLDVIIVYIALIGVITFIVVSKGLNKIKFIYFDLLVFILYIIVTIIDITVIKSETLHVLITIIGLWYISLFYYRKTRIMN